MPSVSERQHRAMEAAAHGHSTLGIPESVGKEFVAADSAARADCAGILFRVQGPRYLLVKRSDTGEWEQPGGHLDGDENPEQAAVRECVEEIGGCPDGPRWAATRMPLADGGGEYTCFLQEVAEAFQPKLNDEHTAWGWFAPDELPEGMHPQVERTIRLVTGNELDIARNVMAGALLSPQRYANLWLFDLRVTGTGLSYRVEHKEYVVRPEHQFLTDEFVARCNGLPVIFEHPEKTILNTEEYRSRSIGTVFLPYIKGDEVRCVAKVFDADAAALMQTEYASTSPAVVFRDAGSTVSVEVDGKTVLIEGKPSYLDHLAICKAGVWDKGGEPSGVNNGDPEMAEPTEVKQEEQVPAWADALGKRFDALEARFDSIENKGGDSAAEKAGAAEMSDEEKAAAALAEAEKAGKAEHEAEARADAAEAKAKEEKARADSAHARNAELEAQIKAMDVRLTSLTTPLSASDRDALASAQARADSVMQMFGDSASAPLHGEDPISYRKRLATKLQKHSADMKDVKLDSIEGNAFNVIEDRIYADAQTVARTPAGSPAGRLISHVRMDEAGRRITTFTGDIDTWMNPFKSDGAVCKLNRDSKGA